MVTCATMAWAVDVTNEGELIAAVETESESTITLTNNITLTNTLTIKRNLTLDLNGHSITSVGKRAIHITSGEDVVITSNTTALIGTSGSIAANSSVIRVGDDNGDERNVKLTLGENIVVSTSKCYGITVFGSKTKETLVVNGTVTTTDIAASAISGNGNDVSTQTEITINETAIITSTKDVAIYHPQNGTLTVNGAITGAGGIEIKAGKLVVGDDAKISVLDGFEPTHPSPNNNGTSTIGYAIAIVENGSYAGVSTVIISSEAEINGPVATVFDSVNSTTENVTFDGGVKMAVEIVGGGKYMNFADALKACTDGAKLKLLENVTENETSVINQNITLDLNGQTFTSEGMRAFWVKNGSLSVTTPEGSPATIKAEGGVGATSSVIRLGDNDGTTRDVSLTIGKGVTIETDDCYGVTAFGTATKEKLTVYGNIKTKVSPAIGGNGTDKTNGADITIAEGAVISTENDVAIYNPQNGTLIVNGTVTGAGGIEMKAGSLTVEGNAIITATGTPTHTPKTGSTSTLGYAIAIVENTDYGTSVTNVEIKNGATINGIVSVLQDSPNSSFHPTITENGVTLTTVAAIGNDEYFKLTDAFDIVTTTGTVKLLQDIQMDSPLALSREITSTLDLNGHKLAGTNCAAVAITNGHVTITSTADSQYGTVTSNGSGAVILLGDDTGEKRATSLTIGENVNVTTETANGINIAGSKTRETLTVFGNVSTSGKPAIIGSGDAEKGGTTITIAPSSTITTSNNVAIYHPQSGELVVDGSVIGTGTAGAIEMKGGDLTVNAGATVTAAGSPTHTASVVTPSTNGFAIAIVENENFSGVGKVFIDKTAHITGVIASLIDSKNNNVAEPEFNGDVYMLAEVMMTETYGDKYAELADAVAAAEAEKTIRLLDYVTLTETLNINKKITLDFDVYDITGNQASGATIAISNDATIKNGGIITALQGISITSGTVHLQQLEIKADAGSLVVSGGTVNADKSSVFSSSSDNTIAISNGAKCSINGKVENTGAKAAIASTGTDVNTTLTVNNGATITSATGKGIDWESAGTLTIDGGKVTGADAVYANAGTVTINAGTFKGAGAGYALNIVGSTCEPAVKHGTFDCKSAEHPIVANIAKGFVEGDYFKKTIAQDLCASGYMISESTNNNGMYYLISELVITDATVWSAPTTTYTIKKAKYIRNSGMGTTKFGTLCLPFAFSATQADMTFYKVNRIEDDWLYLDIVTTTDVNAGTPVIFQRTGEDLKTTFSIETDNAMIDKETIPQEANRLVGSFTKMEITSDLDNIYYLNGDHFHQADTLTVPAFRAYIKYDSSSPARVLNICTEDDNTEDIETVLLDGGIDAVFDLQGRMLDGLQKGMNIMKMSNGKTIKVYVNE